MAGDDDEFPSEQTRIDPGFHQAGNDVRSVGNRPSAGGARPPSVVAAGAVTTSASKDQSAKLAALQSLSHDAPPLPQSKSSSPRQPNAGGSKLPWVLLTLVLAAVGGNWAWTRYHGGGGGALPGYQTDPAGGDTIKSEVVTATGGGGAAPLVSAGFTAARDPIAVGVPVGGMVKAVNVVNGDKVKAGRPIVLLDDSTAVADKSLALAEIHDAERNLAQINALAKAQAATVVDVGKARGAVEIARAKLRPIEQRIRLMKILAPLDVTVLEVLVHPGETVASSASVVKVADLTKLVAEIDISESDMVKVRRGQAAEVVADTYADRVYKGVVREIAEQADKTRGTVLIKVDLQVPDQSLRPGLSIKCTFLPGQDAKPRIFVSRGAVTAKGTVFVVASDRRVQEKAVVTQPGTGSTVEVTSGISSGDRIVSNASQVHDGQTLPTAQ